MLDDELPVKVHAILALTQMIVVHESSPSFHLAPYHSLMSQYTVRNTVAPQIGKLVQGENRYISRRVEETYPCPDLLKLCDETELESLNTSLKAIVAYYQEELLPVAVDLAVRLVRDPLMPSQAFTHLEIVVRYLFAVGRRGRFKGRGHHRS